MKNQLKELFSSLQQDLKIIDNLIADFAKGKSPLIQELSEHLIFSGGKRIRPILLILSSNLFQKNLSNQNEYKLAAAVELIHSATLLHDDVVDDSEIRRGKKTANAIWDNKASILVGDYLFSTAFQLMTQTKNLEVLSLLSKASSIMADGEVMQLENSTNINITKEQYFNIIFGKTAILFSAACEAGSLINNQNLEISNSLRDFGKNLGIIFQIIDDLLDYTSDDKTLGKQVGNDFFEGKITLPVILAYENSNQDDKNKMSDLFQKSLISSEKNHEDFQNIFNLIEKNGGFEKSANLVKEFEIKALNNLQIFSDSKVKENLQIILKYSSSRVN
jgi:octaprenyl-diphosphate synthase